MSGIIDIAKLAGVSKSTVSRVVGNSGYVKPETRAKIEKVMEELNFRPNMFAKGMRTNRSFSIGIIFPDLSNPFFPEWYEIVDRISHERGYLNYICITDPQGISEEQRIDDLLARSIDGIIFFSYHKHPEVWEKLRKITIHTPVVCCDSVARGEELSYVFADGMQGVKKATQYLIDSGRRRIAFIRGRKEYEVTTDRFNGYCEALKDNCIYLDERLVYEGNFRRECGEKAASYFMGLSHPPDAIMAVTDNMALGAVQFLKKNNYRIPEQLAVFGFDNLHISEDMEPSLSSVAIPTKEMAEYSINTLISLIEKNTQPIQKVFDCTLVIRESTKK
ncbi:MAG: LacI family DNA-binding transcriptional regulator [Prolixibacteraceae bacterium]|jgi:DNA-binding LacI/PurR family transcriptional regulator|nr:LacI family DNA-binding transcriptional regulator [Prolixibacteraceae bacterium]